MIGNGLAGVGVLSQLSQLSPNTSVLSTSQLHVLWWVALIGFVLKCIGSGVTALFAADAKQLAITQQQTSNDIENLKSAVRTGDTSIIARNDVASQQKQP